MLSFDDSFDETFEDLNLDIKFIRRLKREIDEAFRRIKDGEIEGNWEIKEINEPGMKGFIVRGRFASDDILEPLKPLERRPLPEKPLEPQHSLNESREPLVDVSEEDNVIKIYVELHGEEEKNIQVGFRGDNIEIKAKNFYKKIKLPDRDLAKEMLGTEYKNGLFTITIPRKLSLRKEDAGKERMM